MVNNVLPSNKVLLEGGKEGLRFISLAGGGYSMRSVRMNMGPPPPNTLYISLEGFDGEYFERRLEKLIQGQKKNLPPLTPLINSRDVNIQNMKPTGIIIDSLSQLEDKKDEKTNC